MTTGRINQVTILSLCTEMRGQPPKGSEFTKQEGAEAPQITAMLGLRAPTAQATDSIAPTEFLKNWSATSHTQRFRRNISAAYSSQEEEAYALSRICTRKLGKTAPKDLVYIWR